MRRAFLPFGMAVMVAVATTVTATPASAFLEFLFGGGQRQPAQAVPSYSSRPLDISVRPKRAARGHAEKPRHGHKRELGRREKGSKVAGERSSDKPKVVAHNRQKAINPEANPDWFLTDPTIRYGDILILKTGAVVYQGSSKRNRVEEDFVSLGQSRIISSARLRDIRMMVSGVWTPPEAGAPSGLFRKKRRHASR